MYKNTFFYSPDNNENMSTPDFHKYGNRKRKICEY